MPKLKKNKFSVSVSITFNLLSEVDSAAYSSNESRSEFIVKAIKERLEQIKNKNTGISNDENTDEQTE